MIQKPKSTMEEQKRGGGKIIQKIFRFALKPLDNFISLCYNIFTINRKVVLFMKLNYDIGWNWVLTLVTILTILWMRLKK